MAKFVCPYCIHQYSKNKIKYFCPDCNQDSKRGFLEPEPVKCKNPQCGKLATKRICPKCGEEITKSILETKNLPFSIVGVSTSGKTNYITVMLNELMQASDLALSAETHDTQVHQEKMYDSIYIQHRPPGSTDTSEITAQIWSVKNLKKKHGSKIPTYTFTIFDGAGERLENLSTDSVECRYINASKAIILLLDPLILQGLDLDRQAMLNSLNGGNITIKNSVNVVNSVAAYIKQARGIHSDQLLDIPVAVVLSKFDMVWNHSAFPSNPVVKHESMMLQDGVFNESEMYEVDAQIRSWLERIGEAKFIKALTSNFREFYFFGVSSYGSAPKSSYQLPDEIKPHRVLDPILWLFHREKFID